MKSLWHSRFGISLALACCWALAAAQGARKAREAAPALRTDPAPFHAGEQLDYHITWSHFSMAATARMTAVGRGPFYGSPAWHFRATASSVYPLRYIFPFDDQFDSYADAATLASRQYEAYLREQGKHTTRIVRMSDGREPGRTGGPMTVVLPGTRDPLAAAYFLRAVDWQRQKEVSCPVYDGAKYYELEARLEETDARVTVAAGSYYAWQIGLRVVPHGRSAPALSLTVWIAHDPAHTPVLAEGDLPMGSVRAELARAAQ
jgi:Protein of unknown function (DUF3108)